MAQWKQVGWAQAALRATNRSDLPLNAQVCSFSVNNGHVYSTRIRSGGTFGLVNTVQVVCWMFVPPGDERERAQKSGIRVPFCHSHFLLRVLPCLSIAHQMMTPNGFWVACRTYLAETVNCMNIEEHFAKKFYQSPLRSKQLLAVTY